MNPDSCTEVFFKVDQRPSASIKKEMPQKFYKAEMSFAFLCAAFPPMAHLLKVFQALPGIFFALLKSVLLCRV